MKKYLLMITITALSFGTQVNAMESQGKKPGSSGISRAEAYDKLYEGEYQQQKAEFERFLSTQDVGDRTDREMNDKIRLRASACGLGSTDAKKILIDYLLKNNELDKKITEKYGVNITDDERARIQQSYRQMLEEYANEVFSFSGPLFFGR